MLALVAPVIPQDNVEDCPAVIGLALAVKEPITGGFTAGFTVTVTVLVTLCVAPPVPVLEAVRV